MLKAGIVGALCLVCFVSIARAAEPDDTCEDMVRDCVAVGKWNFSLGMGVGVRTNPLINKIDIPTVFIPQFSYYGKRFFLDNFDVGYSVLENDSSTISLLASPAYDRAFSNDNQIQDVLLGGGLTAATPSKLWPSSLKELLDPLTQHPNDLMYLGGVEWAGRYGAVTTRLDLLYDLRVRVHASEARASIAMPLAAVLGGSLDANLGVIWNSTRYSFYFYNIGQNAANPYLTLTYARPIARRWRFNTFIQYERLGLGIERHGFLSQQFVATAFAGVFYDF